MTTNAVDDAVALLVGRREDLIAEKARLDTESAQLDEALAALGRDTKGRVLPRHRVQAPVKTGPDESEVAEKRPSVRALVEELLESQDRSWTTTEVLEELKSRRALIGAKDPASSVRTAIWHLTKSDTVIRLGDRLTHRKWVRVAGGPANARDASGGST